VDNSLIVAPFFGVPNTVAFGFDIQSTIAELSPVNASVAGFVSSTEPVTVGKQSLFTA
jgi:hypothetical protein